MSDSRYFAKIPFNYGGRELDRGEVFALRSLPNDRLLIDLNYVGKIDASMHTFKNCDNCSRIFVGESFLIGHKKKKGGCLAEQIITKAETASLIGADPSKVVVE